MSFKRVFSVVMLCGILFVGTNVSAKSYGTINGKNSYFLDMTRFEIGQGLIVTRNSDILGDVGEVPVTLRYGVLKNMELGLAIPYIFYEDIKDGFGDVVMTQKFKFNEEQKNVPSFSGGFNVGFPTSAFDTEPFVSKKLDFELFLIFSKNMQHCMVAGDIGINFVEGGEDSEFSYRLGINVPVNNNIKFVTELNGVNKKYYDEYYGTPAIIFETPEGLNLRLGVPIGLNKESYGYKIAFNLSHTF